MKIYTKTGDQGETGLLGGVRVSKSHLAIDVCGSLDELNSILGLTGSFLTNRIDQGDLSKEQVAQLAPLRPVLTQFQADLFDLGSCVAACLSDSKRTSKVAAEKAAEMESLIDQMEEDLPAMTAFILPDGSMVGCQLHHARSVCRRTERRMVALENLLAGEGRAVGDSIEQGSKGINQNFKLELVYLNRLSDLLFVMARFCNQILGQPETKWLPNQG